MVFAKKDETAFAGEPKIRLGSKAEAAPLQPGEGPAYGMEKDWGGGCCEGAPLAGEPRKIQLGEITGTPVDGRTAYLDIPDGHVSTVSLPADVVRLVIAARQVAFGDFTKEDLRELDQASEAFADRVPWENEPNEDEGEEIPDELVGDVEELIDGLVKIFGEAEAREADHADPVNDVMTGMSTLNQARDGDTYVDPRTGAPFTRREGKIQPGEISLSRMPSRMPLSDDVVRLVIAARIVAYEDQGPDALNELDKAAEAFADRVAWEDEPEEESAAAVVHNQIDQLAESGGSLPEDWYDRSKWAGTLTFHPGEEQASSVAHPPHYTAHPSGVECITVAEHFNFNLGNALKYIWRAGLKGDDIEDLEKGRQYLGFEIAKRRREAGR